MNTTPADGGTEWELQQAELAMVAAGDDAAARALAMRRHAEAIRNMMQGTLVPSFVGLVERVLGEKIDPVAADMSGLRTDVQRWASESATRLGKLEDGQARHAAQIADALARLDHKRAEIDEMKREIAEIQAWRAAQERGHGQ